MLVKNYVLNKHPFFSFLDYFFYIMQFNHKLSIMIVKQKKNHLTFISCCEDYFANERFYGKKLLYKAFSCSPFPSHYLPSFLSH